MINIVNNIFFDPFTFQYIDGEKTYSLSNNIPKEIQSIVIKNNIKYLSLFTTNDCNLSCPYCYEKNKRKQVMEFKCIEKILSVFGNKMEKVQFFGGEPLLQKDFIKNAHNTLYSFNPKIKFSIITNLLLLDDSFISWMNSVHLDHVGVSWDGFGDLGRYGYDIQKSELVLDKINKLQNSNIKFSVRMTVSETKIEDLKRSYNYLVERKIPFEIEPVFDYSKNDISNNIRNVLINFYNEINVGNLGEYHSIKRLLQSGMFKYYGCAAGRHSVSVDTNGDIYDCHRMIPNRNNFIGNIYEINDATEINNEKYYKYKCNLREECAKCDYRYLCGGGCVYSHSENYCDVLKTKYRAILARIWNENFNDNLIE